MKKIILSLALAAVAASCSVYRPQIVDIPLIEEKGDTRIDASAGLSLGLFSASAAFGVTATHGFTDILSGQLHANYAGGSNFYLQAAPGIHTRVGSSATFEAFAGVGYGGSGYDATTTSTSSDGSSSSSGSYSYNGTYLLPFAQLNFGWRHLGPCEIAFGLKAGAFLPDYEYHRYNSEGAEDLDRYRNYKTTNALLEPQLQFRVGGEKVKYTLRLGYAWLDDVMRNSESNFTYDFLTVSNGITVSF